MILSSSHQAVSTKSIHSSHPTHSHSHSIAAVSTAISSIASSHTSITTVTSIASIARRSCKTCRRRSTRTCSWWCIIGIRDWLWWRKFWNLFFNGRITLNYFGNILNWSCIKFMITFFGFPRLWWHCKKIYYDEIVCIIKLFNYKFNRIPL